MTVIVCLSYQNCGYLVGDTAISLPGLIGSLRPHPRHPLCLKLYLLPFCNSVLGFSGNVEDIRRFLALLADFVFSSASSHSFNDGRLIYELPNILETDYRNHTQNYSLEFICAGIKPIIKPYKPIACETFCYRFAINEQTGRAIKTNINKKDAIGNGAEILRLPSHRSKLNSSGGDQQRTDKTNLEDLYLAFDGLSPQYVVEQIPYALHWIFKSYSEEYFGVGGAYQVVYLSEIGIQDWISYPSIQPSPSKIIRNGRAVFTLYEDPDGKQQKKVLQYFWDTHPPDFLDPYDIKFPPKK